MKQDYLMVCNGHYFVGNPLRKSRSLSGLDLVSALEKTESCPWVSVEFSNFRGEFEITVLCPREYVV